MTFLRRHRLIIATVGCILLLAVLVGWVATRGQRVSAGPLHGPVPSGTGITVPALNQGVTIGDWALRNSGSQPATIQKMTLIHPSRGLRVLGFSLAHFSKHSVGAGDTYPPTGLQLLSIHTPIPPSDRLHSIELIGGFSIPHSGRFIAKGFRVTYTEDGHTYQMTVNEGVAFCYPLSAYPNASGGCESPLPVSSSG